MVGNEAVGGSPSDGAEEGLRREQAPLTSSDLTLWIALRRVDGGGVAWWQGSYYHHGRAVPEYLNAPLTELVEAGRLELAQAEPETGGLRRVGMTERGRELYAVLCGKPGVCLAFAVAKQEAS